MGKSKKFIGKKSGTAEKKAAREMTVAEAAEHRLDALGTALDALHRHSRILARGRGLRRRHRLHRLRSLRRPPHLGACLGATGTARRGLLLKDPVVLAILVDVIACSLRSAVTEFHTVQSQLLLECAAVTGGRPGWEKSCR